MIPNTLSLLWKALAPALGDHLWQSTVVALVAALLTMALRKNHARARYWIWLAASLKFLVPFSWFVVLGNHLSWRSPAGTTTTALYYTVEEFSRPFTQSVAAPAKWELTSASPTHLLPPVLIAIWAGGFLAVLLGWCVRWRRISAEVQKATLLEHGREFEALRRMQREAGVTSPLELRLSRSTLEPGIFGIARPVLLWPEGISQRLNDSQLQAVIAHELWHVRRRDNLAAVFHMLVEAIFWFHPLVWWVGARLIDERERACDEEVLASGSERQTYAESILKVCEFCVGSPLACVSGVTGADLKKRMVHIMSEQVAGKLDLTRRFLLAAVAVAVIAAPLVFGIFHATTVRAQSQDENAASNSSAAVSANITPSELSTPTYAGSKTHMTRMMIGPKGFDARNATLRALIQEAYQVQANQITGGPGWLDTAAFDVDVKTGKSSASDANPEKLMAEHVALIRSMLQALLADRAKLALHTATKDLETYSLTIADNGPKLQPAPAGESDEPKEQGAMHMGRQQMRMQIGGNQVYGIGAQSTSLDDFAQQLSRQLGTPVINKTGLHGRYDFNLQWSDANGGSNGSEPSILDAVQEQLGLKLEPQKAPTQVLVIDHIQNPTVTQASD
jgi:bla regulator protein blaR1